MLLLLQKKEHTLWILYGGIVAMLNKVDVSEMQNASNNRQNAILVVLADTHHAHCMLTHTHVHTTPLLILEVDSKPVGNAVTWKYVHKHRRMDYLKTY